MCKTKAKLGGVNPGHLQLISLTVLTGLTDTVLTGRWCNMMENVFFNLPKMFSFISPTRRKALIEKNAHNFI